MAIREAPDKGDLQEQEEAAPGGTEVRRKGKIFRFSSQVAILHKSTLDSFSFALLDKIKDARFLIDLYLYLIFYWVS